MSPLHSRNCITICIGKTDYDLSWSKEESGFYRLVDKKVMDSGKPEINFEEQEDKWVFSVCDNGIGIEEEYAQTIFKAFKRLNTRSGFSGSGIGLSVCKGIVILHGGDIWIESKSDIGTKLYFSLKKDLK